MHLTCQIYILRRVLCVQCHVKHMCLLVQFYTIFSVCLCTPKIEKHKCQLKQVKKYIYILCLINRSRVLVTPH